jgi:serine/threonine protein phosphatase PrpC
MTPPAREPEAALNAVVAPEGRWRACAASWIGPAHVKAGLPNQDAWRRLQGRFGVGVVVCDGVGSVPYADFGSRMACDAVAEAVRLWFSHVGATDEQLLRMIHLQWGMRIVGRMPQDCATTCLFALALSKGELLLGQLGDGGMLIADNDGTVEPLTPLSDGFANAPTTGLGVAHRLSEWTLKRLSQDNSPLVALATDGVYNDLIPDAWPDFIGFLKTAILVREPRPQRRALQRFLRDWERPHHHDDKTIGILWRHAPEPTPHSERSPWKPNSTRRPG